MICRRFEVLLGLCLCLCVSVVVCAPPDYLSYVDTRIGTGGNGYGVGGVPPGAQVFL